MAQQNYISYISLRMPLSERDLQSLCKTRKLKELKEACYADVWISLHQELQVLEVSGAPEAVYWAQHKLAQRIGPQKDLSAGLWSELIRTIHDECGVLRQVQRNTGARLHMEREALKVRIFGPADAVALASVQLDQLEQQCIEVRWKAAANLDKALLDTVSTRAGVTLRFEMNEICVRGFKSSVQNAIFQIEGMLSSGSQNQRMEHASLPNGLAVPVPLIGVPVQCVWVAVAPVQLQGCAPESPVPR